MNNLNDDDLDPFIRSLADKDANLEKVLEESKKFNDYKSLINDDEKQSFSSNNLIYEAEGFLSINPSSNNDTQFQNQRNTITTKLDEKVKSLKSQYRSNRRAYLFGEMLPSLDIQLQEENSKIKSEYEKLIDIKEKLRSKFTPNDDGYDSPIEALYSRQEYLDTYENANTLLDGTQAIINSIPIIKSGKGIAKGAIKGAKAGVNRLKNSAYIRGGKTSIKSIIRKKSLPTKGKIRFVPREADKKMGKILERDKGYVDKFGNIWKKPKVENVKNYKDIHWDVQLSKKGKQQLSWLSNSGDHLNVTQKGIIHH